MDLDDNLTGIVKELTQNGSIVVPLVNGEIDGCYKYIDDDGVILQEINYKNGILSGDMRQYYKSGVLMLLIKYDNGQTVHEVITYYENGMLQSRTPYSEGKVDGIYKAYDEFGDNMIEIEYKQGKRNGRTVTYYPKLHGGGVYEVSEYKNDLLHGMKHTYDKAGNVASITPYKNGRAQRYAENITI